MLKKMDTKKPAAASGLSVRGSNIHRKFNYKYRTAGKTATASTIRTHSVFQRFRWPV